MLPEDDNTRSALGLDVPGGEAAITRRDTLKGGAAGAFVLAIAGTTARADVEAKASPSPVPVNGERLLIRTTVNGQLVTAEIDTRTSLLDLLREHLALTGTKKGCDHGQCGACTVMVDGRRMNSCLSLAVMHEGGEITTIEGLGTPDDLHPMQDAFVKHDGYQCGYCTSGQICSAVAVLEEVKAGIPSHVTADLTSTLEPTPEEMRERMSGNLCRCGAYSNIADAMAEVAGRPA